MLPASTLTLAAAIITKLQHPPETKAALDELHGLSQRYNERCHTHRQKTQAIANRHRK